MTAEPAPDWTQEPGVQAALAEGAARATFDPEALAAAVWDFKQATDALNTATLGLSKLGWEDLAALLDGVQQARKLAQTVEAIIESATARAMGEAEVKAGEVDGVGMVEWKRGRERKAWQHDELAAAVLDAKLAELEGEVPDPWTVRDVLLGAAHVDYWRVKQLRELGIDVDEFCYAEPGRVSVQITRPGPG